MGVRLSYSSRQAFLRCQEFWRRRYVLKQYIPEEKSPDLIFGNAFHESLALYMRGERDPYKLRGAGFKVKGMNAKMKDVFEEMLGAYLHMYTQEDGDRWEVIMVEDKTRYSLDGQLDVTVIFDALLRDRRDGKVYLFEHKTTKTPDISAAGMWWLRKQTDQQTRLYAHAAAKLGHPVDYICFDVIRRPAYKTPGKHKVEVPKNPHKFLQRHIIEYSEKALEKNAKDFANTHALMQYCVKNNCFSRNGGACQDFNRQCEYYEDCWGDE